MNLEDFKDKIELTCLDEEHACAINDVLKQYEPLKDYCQQMMYDFASDGDNFTIQSHTEGNKVFVELLRPDYRGLLDPNFYDGSFEGICNYLEGRIPGAILSGVREFYNFDLSHSFAEYLSREANGSFSCLAVEEDEGFEDDEWDDE